MVRLPFRLLLFSLAAPAIALIAASLIIGWLGGTAAVTGAVGLATYLGVSVVLLGVGAAVWTSRLRASHYRERLRYTVRSLHEAVIATDARGTVTAMNGPAESITGWPESEALGQPIGAVFRLVDARTHRPVVNPVVKALYKNVTIGPSSDTLLVDKDGIEREIRELATPIRDDAGRVFAGAVAFKSSSAEGSTTDHFVSGISTTLTNRAVSRWERAIC